LARSSRGRLEDSFQVLRNNDLGPPVGIATVVDLSDVRGNFSSKPRQINAGRPQNARRILILGQRQQQVLERHLRMLLGIRIAGCARKRRSKVLRHGDAPKIIDYHPPKPSTGSASPH
jgi:hypothetical protein